MANYHRGFDLHQVNFDNNFVKLFLNAARVAVHRSLGSCSFLVEVMPVEESCEDESLSQAGQFMSQLNMR